MDYQLRQLSTGDIAWMRELNSLFGDVFEDDKTYTDKIPSDEYLTSFLNNKAHIVLVAIAELKVIGGLVAYTLAKFEMERSEVYIYDLAVSRNHQKKGVGRSLVEQLKITARAAGAYVVFVQADEGDKAVEFYESLSPNENIQARSFDYLT